MKLKNSFFERWEEGLLPTGRGTATPAPAAGALTVWRMGSRGLTDPAGERGTSTLAVSATAPPVWTNTTTHQPAPTREASVGQVAPGPLLLHVCVPPPSRGGRCLGTTGPLAVDTHTWAQPQPSTESRGPALSAGEAEDGDATSATVLADLGAGSRLAGHMSSEGAPIAVTAY